VLGSYPDPQDLRRPAPKPGAGVQQLQRPGHRQLALCTGNDRLQHAIVNGDLHRLDHLHREQAAPLIVIAVDGDHHFIAPEMSQYLARIAGLF